MYCCGFSIFSKKKRKKLLDSRQILDKIEYQVGNIVLATNIPSSKKQPNTTSQELKMTVQGLYYVKEVGKTHLCVIGLFTGDEQNFAREYCTKITLHNLAKLQFQIQSLQLQKIASNLYRANKYLAPQDAKTWNHLLDRNREPEITEHDLSEFDQENSDTFQPDIVAPELADSDPDIGELEPVDSDPGNSQSNPLPLQPPGQATVDQVTESPD